MCTRSIFFVAVVAAVATVANSQPASTPIVNEQKLNNTPFNPMVGTDKYFWEWLYDMIAGRPATTTTTTEAPKPAEPESCLPCNCGLTNKQNRIVGGVETQVNQYPWMVVMLYRGKFYCGGTVINSRYVLTAAHCVDRFDAKFMSVRILEHDQSSTTDTESKEYKVDRLVRHSGYSTFNYNNDIALVRLQESIKFEGKMRPVCLPERAKTFSGMNATVTGWGAIEESGPISQTLQEVTVPILSNAQCRATNYPARKITDNMLCAGYTEGSKDSCQGDSGGPLHIIDNNIHKVVGVVSWGEGCAKPNYPGVYARVNRYLTWIRQNTADACYC